MRHAGEGITLRPYEESDLDAVSGYLTGWELSGRRGFEHDRYRAMSRAEVAKELEGWAVPENGEVFVIAHHDVVIGHVRSDVWWDAMTPFTHVVIAPGSRRHGYGSGAARLMLAHLFEDTPAHAVHAWIDEDDEIALAFATRLGFSVCGRLRRAGIRGGRYVDSLALELFRQDWEGSGGSPG